MFGQAMEKTWVLLANYTDDTLIHDYIAYDLYRYLSPDSAFVPMSQFVDLYINNVYIGVYMLTDQISADTSRINIRELAGYEPEKSDYLIEQEFRLQTQEKEGENIDWFWSRYNSITYKVHVPEEGISHAQLEYIRDYTDKLYLLILHKDWERVEQLIDVDSFITYFMVEDMLREGDVQKASNFYMKRAGGKLTVATIWDCDFTFGSGGSWYPVGSVNRSNYLFDALMEIPEFRERYLEAFYDCKDDAYNRILNQIDLISSQYHDEFENDYFNWEIDNEWVIDEMKGLDSYDEQIERMKWWIEAQFMNLEDQYMNDYG